MEDEPDTIPFITSQFELAKPLASEASVDVYAISDKGLVRPNNEDHYLVVRLGRSMETILSNLGDGDPEDFFEETAFGMIVADGLGGQNAGEVASQQAISSLMSLALNTADWQFNWGPAERNKVMWRMQDRFRRVNEKLLERSAADPSLRGMSTTLTAALTLGKDLIIGHVGDSRAYLLHEGKLKKLTRDHTLAQSLLDEGLCGSNDTLILELRNILVQAVGSAESECRPDVHDHVLADGDQLLLCTDGLTDMVEERLIESILVNGTSAMSTCRTLVDLALSNGGRDNITAIVAKFSLPSEES